MGSTPMRRTFVRLLGLATAVLAVVAAVDFLIETDAEKIERRLEEGRRAIVALDTDAVCAVLAEDFHLSSDIGTVRRARGDREGLRAQLRSQFSQTKSLRLDVDHLEFLPTDPELPDQRAVQVRGFLRVDTEDFQVPITYSAELVFVRADGDFELLEVRDVELELGVF